MSFHLCAKIARKLHKVRPFIKYFRLYTPASHPSHQSPPHRHICHVSQTASAEFAVERRSVHDQVDQVTRSAMQVNILLRFLGALVFWTTYQRHCMAFLWHPPTRSRPSMTRAYRMSVAQIEDFSIELSQTLNVPSPSYVQILQEDSLLVTSFSILRRGSITKFDLHDKHRQKFPLSVGSHAELVSSLVNDPVHHPSQRLVSGEYQWPNELSHYTSKNGEKVMLVADGFLMPGQDDGAIYVVHKADTSESIVQRITRPKNGWFYHRAVHVVIPGADGTPLVEGILTARAKKGLYSKGRGELVWLSIPKELQMHKYGEEREEKRFKRSWQPSLKQSLQRRQASNHRSEGNQRHSDQAVAPDSEGFWHEKILAVGPDVMFEVLDFDASDQSIEVVAAHFFGRKISLHSLRYSSQAPHIEVADSSVLHTTGTPYGLCLASLTADGADAAQVPVTHTEEECRTPLYCHGGSSHQSGGHVAKPAPTHLLVTTHESSLDILSAVNMARTVVEGGYPRIRSVGRAASEVCTKGDLCVGTANNQDHPAPGGSLYAYELPKLHTQASSGFDQVDEDFESCLREEVNSHHSILRVAGVGRGGHRQGTHGAASQHRGGQEQIRRERATFAVKAIATTLECVRKNPNHDRRSPRSQRSSQALDGSNATAAQLALTKMVPAQTEEEKQQREYPARRLPVSQWRRHTLCSGFRVKGWGGLFAPGAPGFPYAFHMPNNPQAPPLILVAGDCAGSAYLFAPSKSAVHCKGSSVVDMVPPSSAGGGSIDAAAAKDIGVSDFELDVVDDDFADVIGAGEGEVGQTGSSTSGGTSGIGKGARPIPQYELLFEIECGATVGSAAVQPLQDGSGDVNLFVPAYELNKVHVFRLSEQQPSM